jgi:hypothetical protein
MSIDPHAEVYKPLHFEQKSNAGRMPGRYGRPQTAPAARPAMSGGGMGMFGKKKA